MAFCILRTKKIKSASGLRLAAQHNSRERIPDNADPEKTPKNWSTGTSDDVMDKYQKQLPERYRKDAVHAVELVLAASPGFKGSWADYLITAGEWAEKTFGKENILHITHHNDELTPHAHVLLMPLRDKKLNAKHWLGGKAKMENLQDSFYGYVKRKFPEIERGQKKAVTRARHNPHTLAKKGAQIEETLNELKEWKEVLKGKNIEQFINVVDVYNYWFDRTGEDLMKIGLAVEYSGKKTYREFSRLKDEEKRHWIETAAIHTGNKKKELNLAPKLELKQTQKQRNLDDYWEL